MRFLHFGVERLLLGLLWIARFFFILQGVAFATASIATFAAAGSNAPPWLQGAMAKGATISGTFVVAGVLLVAARRWRVAPTDVGKPTWPWPLLLGLSLLLLPAATALASSGLPPMWSRIAHHLRAIGFWDAAGRSDPYGGIVLLPIMVSLLVPVLVTAAAAFSIVFPLALLPLLTARRRLFPTLLAMGAICQVGLVLASWIAVDVLAGLGTQAQASMAASGDAEVLRLGEELDWATGILTRTTRALMVPALGMLAWLIHLRPSGAAMSYFSAGVPPTDDALRAVRGPVQAAVELSTRVAQASATPSAASSQISNDRPRLFNLARIAHFGLAVLGVLAILVGAANTLRTQASYVGSQPAPGASLGNGPAALRVTFSAALDPGSSLSLTRLAGPSAGEGPRDIAIASRLAPDDRDRRTIEGVPGRKLSTGLYRVAWWARPLGGRGAQQGMFSFGIGVPVPGDTTGNVHSLSERDAGARTKRRPLIAGLVLIVLSIVLRLSTRRR